LTQLRHRLSNRAWLPTSSNAISFNNFGLKAWRFLNDAPPCDNSQDTNELAREWHD
jgi:hypothetical protein